MKGEQQKRHERGETGGEPQPQVVMVMRRVEYAAAQPGPIEVDPESGGKAVQFVVPPGELHRFPLTAEHAQALGKGLLAPSVEVARPGDIPANGAPRA